MKQLNTYLCISERDVDLLILEEFIVSDSFSNWFVSTVLGQSIECSTVGAWHSVSDPLFGESDLVYIYKLNSGSSHALLIENKIDAQAQPEQSTRYQQRGLKGIELEHWSSFQTCIIAPRNYLENNAEIYDSEISYEQIVDYFGCQPDARSTYRASFLKEAIEKNRRGYLACVSESMTLFAEKYLSFVALNYPELNPEKPKPRAAGHTWIHFYPLIHDSNTRIVHQIYGNKVKIIYLGQADRYYEISDKFGQVQDRKYAVKKSGKSVTVEVNCPDINPLTQNFEDVFEQINEAIALALDLKQRLY
ncbi:MAG: PD-(D/E)XK nuclease superfamily protein [Chromatiales bacterium RIFOXYA1_FULL_46_5]|nr:MAG: PD-(D/E)XK nuclease superfamily protein [Chromatiales bacterium RIFOXYA1_FULL_46_5]